MDKRLKGILNMMVERNASDLHIVAGQPIFIRVNGRLVVMDRDGGGYAQEDIEQIIQSILSEKALKEYCQTGAYDVSIPINNESFRINIYKERNNHCLAIRHIPPVPRSFSELGLPAFMPNLLGKMSGLFLVTGPAGSGKSTTISSMVNWLNENKRLHIITIEDPIEYYHVNKKSLICQRQVGRDTESFVSALRQSLRQDPDVIVIGEMRDFESTRLAITAAETGHLVLSTLHSVNAVQAINRIIDVFPAEYQPQIRSQLSTSLTGVLSQRLLPAKDGKGRVLAVEILRGTHPISNLIREDKIHQIPNQLEMGIREGMQTMERSIAQLYFQGKIDKSTALQFMKEVELERRLKALT